MIIVNDNLGIIIDEDYLNTKFFGEYCIKDRDKILKGSRKVEDSQHEKEELKLSVRIAKKNVSYDVGNKYYQGQLELAELRLKNYCKDNLN